MKTAEQMKQRLAEQKAAREAATETLAAQMVTEWKQILEGGIDRAHECAEPRTYVERHSNQLATAYQARYNNEYGDAMERAVSRIIDHFAAQGFECWNTNGTAFVSITVSWNPETQPIQNDV